MFLEITNIFNEKKSYSNGLKGHINSYECYIPNIYIKNNGLVQ